MLMCFRGGGVGHTGTRAATNKFLQDHDRLDLDITAMEGSDDEDKVDEQGSDQDGVVGGASEAKSEGGDDDESENEPQGSGGNVSDLGGGGGDDGLGGSDDDEGVTGDLDYGEGSG